MHNQITRLKGLMRQVLDDRRNVENHGRRGAVLPDLAVDLGHQWMIAGVGNLIPGHHRADRAEGVEGLALAPQPAAVDLEGPSETSLTSEPATWSQAASRVM